MSAPLAAPDVAPVTAASANQESIAAQERLRIQGELMSLRAQVTHVDAMIQFARTRIQMANQSGHPGSVGEVSAAEAELTGHEAEKRALDVQRTQLENELLLVK